LQATGGRHEILVVAASAAGRGAGEDGELAAALQQRCDGVPEQRLRARGGVIRECNFLRRPRVATTRTLQFWQRALKSYETALALDPKDTDAKFNRDLVKKKLEELKKQQQQQQQQNQKNQQDKKQDQKKNDEQQPQQQNQQQNKPDDKQSDQQQQSQQSQEQRDQEQQQKDQQEKQQKDQQKPEQPEQQPQEKGGQPQDYDKTQAATLLDELREDERNWNFFPEVQMKDLKNSGEPAKDW